MLHSHDVSHVFWFSPILEVFEVVDELGSLQVSLLRQFAEIHRVGKALDKLSDQRRCEEEGPDVPRAPTESERDWRALLVSAEGLQTRLPGLAGAV